MKKMNLMDNYLTNAEIVSSDNVKVRFDDFLEGAAKYIECHPAAFKFAEDIMQTVSEKLWSAVPRCYKASKSSPQTYGYRSARNCFLDFLGHSPFDPFSQYIAEGENGDSDIDRRIERGIITIGNPETELVSKDRLNQVWSIVNNRCDTDRAILHMIEEGFSPREIAQKFGMTANAVSVRLWKIRNVLKHELAA